MSGGPLRNDFASEKGSSSYIVEIWWLEPVSKWVCGVRVNGSVKKNLYNTNLYLKLQPRYDDIWHKF